MNFFSHNYLDDHDIIYSPFINNTIQQKYNFKNKFFNPKNLDIIFNKLENPSNIIIQKEDSNITKMNELFTKILSFFPKNNEINSLHNINNINNNNNIIIKEEKDIINTKDNTTIFNQKGNDVQKKVLLKSKRNRSKKGRITNKKKKNEPGRIKKNSNRKGTHDKYSEDNMMRKIKNKVISSANNLLNDILKKEGKGTVKNFKIYKIRGIYSQELHRKFNIWLILQKLKDIFSFEISKFYKNEKDKYINKIIINNIIETDSKDYVNTKILLNMPLHEYIHKIFLNGDKELFEKFGIEKKDENKYKFDKIIGDINKIIKKKKRGEICDNNNNGNKDYREKIKNLAHNYEDYFFGKSRRVSNKVKNDKIIQMIINSQDSDYKKWEEEVEKLKNNYKSKIIMNELNKNI